MDDLRWILALVGAVVVLAIYLSGRFEREEWRRDRNLSSESARHVHSETTHYIQDEPVPEEKFPTDLPLQDSMPEMTIPQEFDSDIIESVAPEQNSKSNNHKYDHKEVSPKPLPVRKVSVGLSSEEDVSRVMNEQDPESTLISEDTKKPVNDWEGAMKSAKQPLIEDEIVAVEIPAEFSEFGEERRSKSRLKLKPEKEEPVQQEMVLDIEPLLLVLNILAKNEGLFSGDEIQKALEAEEVQYGDMEIFHYIADNDTEAVFSVASLVEPGTFDLKTINNYETPGLSLFCQLPGPKKAVDTFKILLDKAKSISEELDGQLCDDKRNLLTEQGIGHYFDQITAFDREMVIARKKLLT